ncbi:hypothetical protein B9J78_05780 [bacterium Unc6]|nr:hypothetical protein [bacterium Unc6]
MDSQVRRSKLKYLLMALQIFFFLVVGLILYRKRELLHRFCRYPFPFIMCPVCDYPCFFQGYRLQEIIKYGAVVTGLIGGRIFCGVACPFGAVQDWFHSLKRRVLSLKVFRSNRPDSRRHLRILKSGLRLLDSGLRFLKYPFFLVVFTYSLIRFALAFDFMPEWGLVPAMTFTMQVRELAGDGHINFWYFSLSYVNFVIFFLIIVFGAGLVLHRPWCKYLCPVGLLFAFLNKISFLKISLERKGCTGCRKCLETCTTGKKFSELEQGFVSVECVRCYDCVLTCPEGVVNLKAGGREIRLQ